MRSIDRWLLIYLSGTLARYLLLRLYFFLLDMHVSEAVQIIVWLVVFLLEMGCLFFLLWELNTVDMLALVARAFVALELLKSSASLAMCVYNAILFKSAAKLSLSLTLLLIPAIFDIAIRIYGYRLVALPREPYHAESPEQLALVSLDNWNHKDSPLSMAYQRQREQSLCRSEQREAGDRSCCSAEEQQLLEVEPPSNFSTLLRIGRSNKFSEFFFSTAPVVIR